MNYVNKLLSKSERVVCITREHWVALLLPILVDVAICIVVVGLSVAGIILSPPYTWFGFLLLVVPLGHLAFQVWVWWNRQIVVTDRRVIQITGMVNKRVSDTLLEKINDIVMEQSAAGRLLGFGDIELISGAESGTDVFRRVADPIGFKKALLDQKGATGQLSDVEGRAERLMATEAPGLDDVPQLIAELDKLRQKGLISDHEFEEKKRRLLDRI